MPQTLFIFATRHGFTKNCVDWMTQQIRTPFETHNLVTSSPKKLTITTDDTIILGGSIHVGTIQKEVASFVESQKERLLNTKVGLFLSCMDEGETAQTDYESAFPEWLRTHATATTFTGAAFYFERMNFLEKWVIKRIHGTTENVEKYKYAEMSKFLQKLGLHPPSPTN